MPRRIPKKLSKAVPNAPGRGADGFVWAVADVVSQPVIQLVRWRIFQIGAERCLYGAICGGTSGRRSSWIRGFDAVAMRVQTASGRTYELVGPPGHDENAQYILKQDQAQGHSITEVTLEACREYGVRSELLSVGTQ